MENRMFFPGLIVLIFGALILVYDIPQIMFIQGLGPEEIQMYENEELDKFQRIQSELYVGAGLLIAGAVMILLARFPPDAIVKK